MASCVAWSTFIARWRKPERGSSGTELLRVVLVGKLEERQAGAVADVEEAVRVGAHLAEQVRLLGPGRYQLEADDLLVELAYRLQVLADVGIVVKARFDLCDCVHSCLPLSKVFCGGVRSFSEALAELEAVARRQRRPDEAARRELRVVLLVQHVLAPERHGPVVHGLEADTHVEQVDRAARGRVRRLPPGLTGAGKVGASDEVHAAEADSGAGDSAAEVQRVLGDQGRLVADPGRVGGTLDLAVGVTEADVAAEVVGEGGVGFELETHVVRLVDVAEVLRAGAGIEEEEIGAVELGVVEREGGAGAAIPEAALGADLEGVGDLLVEEVADAGLVRRLADAGLVETAAAEAAADVRVQGQVIVRLVAQRELGLPGIPALVALVTELQVQARGVVQRRRQRGVLPIVLVVAQREARLDRSLRS
jgi:hypothetical protein